MADWFKMYENGLDEERLVSVLQDEPLTLSVWVWILTQCCKDKSDRFEVSDRIKRGFTLKMNLGVDTFDTALNLLQEIGYVQVENSEVIVPQWDKRQSEYCQKRVRTLSGETPPRGEESRRDKKRIYSVAFNDFWEHYPRKQNKKKAYDSWAKQKLDDRSKELIAAIQKQTQTIYKGQEMRYIPHGATWINQKRWEDDCTAIPDKSTKYEGGSRWISS